MNEMHMPASFTPDWISPPGDSIADLLDELGWTQSEFAERTGFTNKHVSLLINGKASITEETALKLERVVGSNARFWLNREAQYREALARIEEERSLAKAADWLKELPLKDMLKYQWVPMARTPAEQVGECLKFFGVASVSAWKARYREPIAAFRASKTFKLNAAAATAWLRRGELRAASIECEAFDRAKFKAALSNIRAMTNERDPEIFVPALQKACAEAGVAVVFEPAPKGCPVSGATKWLTADKALLMLSLRHRSNDHLWFSLFHEAAHILLHGKKLMFIDAEGMLSSEQEIEADRFATDFLISQTSSAHLPLLKTEAAVINFASKIGIAPGIVVGRMQKEKYITWAHLNHLKVFYGWKTS